MIKQLFLRRKWLFMLVVFCGALYFAYIQAVSLTDPDEVFYSQTAKEMLAGDSFFTPLMFGAPQFEKPPLFYWLLCICFKLFGPTTAAARIPTALFGLLGVVGTYLFARRIAGNRAGICSGFILATMALYFGLSRAVLTDIVFSVLISFCLYSFYLWYKYGRGGMLSLFYVFSAMAALTKGLLGSLIPALTILLFLSTVRDGRRLRLFLGNFRGWLIFTVLTLPWYVYSWVTYGREFWWEFFVHDHWHRLIYAEHKSFDRWYFYPMVIILGSMPWTFYFCYVGRAFGRFKKEHIFLFSWIAAVLLLTVPAHSKLSSYILPMFIPLAVLLGASFACRGGSGARREWGAGIGYIALALTIAIFAPPAIKRQFPSFYLTVISVLAIFCLFILLSGVFLILRRDNYSFVCNVCAIGLFIVVALAVIPRHLDGAFSDDDLPKILQDNPGLSQTILCNKMYSRGAHFYSGRPVAVIDSSSNPFWSKHPIPIFYKDEQVRAFFAGRHKVLCVIQQSNLERLNRLFSGERDNKIISSHVDRIVVISHAISPE
ncbi:MAG: ArnT family glycosyltransferase [Candidatus Omnitrophota bacterium]